MLCCKCRKNQAAKTYEQVKNGEKQTEYYCLDCFERNFLYVEEEEGEKLLSSCPYCGVSKEDILTKKLVGCGYCYATLASVVLPMVVSMQNTTKAHTGKKPPLGEEDLSVAEETPSFPLYEYESKRRKEVRFKRQCHELEEVIGKLLADGDFEGAKEYEEKLKRMKEKSAVEEDFVWRQTNLSRRT